MDKFNFIRDGSIRLPPGFRFQPTDEELVFQYLKRKVLSWPLPASIIPEITLSSYDPWDLPGEMDQDKYFFCNVEAKYRNGNRVNRTTGSGYWKPTGVDKQIVSASNRNSNMLGRKKTLVFYEGKSPHGSKTDWIMHEYRLTFASNPSQTMNNSVQNVSNPAENWALCRIFLKNRSSPSRNTATNYNNNDNAEVARSMFNDFMGRDDYNNFVPVLSSSSSTCSCGGVTEDEVTSRREYE